jgi:hypothetical protein
VLLTQTLLFSFFFPSYSSRLKAVYRMLQPTHPAEGDTAHAPTTNKKRKRNAVDLDPDAWHHICTHIRRPRDIHALGQVCRASHIAANSTGLWKAAYAREFGPPLPDDPPGGWKKSFADASRGVNLCLLRPYENRDFTNVECLGASGDGSGRRLMRGTTVRRLFFLVGSMLSIPPHKSCIHFAEESDHWQRLDYPCRLRVGDLVQCDLLVICAEFAGNPAPRLDMPPSRMIFRGGSSSIFASLPSECAEVARDVLISLGVKFYSEADDPHEPRAGRMNANIPGRPSIQLGTPQSCLTLTADIDASLPSDVWLIVDVGCTRALDFLRQRDEENMRATSKHAAKCGGTSHYSPLLGQDGIARFRMQLDGECMTRVFKRMPDDSGGLVRLAELQSAEWFDHLEEGVGVILMVAESGSPFEQRSYFNPLWLQTVIVL